MLPPGQLGIATELSVACATSTLPRKSRLGRVSPRDRRGAPRNVTLEVATAAPARATMRVSHILDSRREECPAIEKSRRVGERRGARVGHAEVQYESEATVKSSISRIEGT